MIALIIAAICMAGGYLMAEHTDWEEGGVLILCGGIILAGLAVLALI